MCPVSKFLCDLPWILAILTFTPGTRATGDQDNFTAGQTAGMNHSTGNLVPTAPEMLSSYQLPSDTRRTNGSEDRIGRSRDQAGVKITPSPANHHPRDKVQGYANLKSQHQLGIILEALTNPRPFFINDSTPCTRNDTENLFYLDGRLSTHDVEKLERFNSVKNSVGRRDQISQPRIKSLPLLSSKIISERSTIYPFIDATRALDYLSNYDTRPRPKRWPLRIILTETEQRDVERRKKLAEYSTGPAGKVTGSTLVGVLGALTDLLLKSFRYAKRSKRQAPLLESDQLTTSVATPLSSSVGEGFPTDHGVDRIPNPAGPLNQREPMNRIHETNTSGSVVGENESSSRTTFVSNSTRITDVRRNKKLTRRERKRRKEIKSRSRGVDVTNCDKALMNASRMSSVDESRHVKNVNKDDKHNRLNVKNSSTKTSEEAGVFPCDGYKMKKRKRKNGSFKIPSKGRTPKEATAAKVSNPTAPKESTPTAASGSITAASKRFTAMNSPVHVTTISWLDNNTAAETQNTGIFPENKTAADNRTRIILEGEPLKKKISLTDFGPVTDGVSTIQGSEKSDVTGIRSNASEHYVSTPTSSVSFLTGNIIGINRAISTTSPRLALQWRDHLRQQRQRISAATVEPETQTQLKTGSPDTVTQPLPSTRSVAIEEVTTTFTTKYKSVYDFLSAQQGLRRETSNNSRKEAEAFNRRLAENLCKIFGKRYVPTPIGGKCE